MRSTLDPDLVAEILNERVLNGRRVAIQKGWLGDPYATETCDYCEESPDSGCLTCAVVFCHRHAVRHEECGLGEVNYLGEVVA